MASCTEGPQGWTRTPKHGPCLSVTGKPSGEALGWPPLGRVLSPPCPSSPAGHCSSQEAFAFTGFENREAAALLPIKAASPRSIPTEQVLTPFQAQNKGKRDTFKFSAHPHRFISSAHQISTCTTERTSLPPSTLTRRAPGSQQASDNIPHPAWIHFQKSPARLRIWGTPRTRHPLVPQRPAPHLRICIPSPWSHRASSHPSPGSHSPHLVVGTASASLAGKAGSPPRGSLGG